MCALGIQYRPTMKDVARMANCDTSTVSLALRGDPRISNQTRGRVMLAAESLGYNIHPMISAWVSARRNGRPMVSHLPLAYLTWSTEHEESESAKLDRAAFEGAQPQARQLGFALSAFHLSDYSSNLHRLHQILTVRRVQGIILGPPRDQARLPDWDWSPFSLIAIGSGLISPVVHRVVGEMPTVLKTSPQSCDEILDTQRRIGRNAVDWLVRLIVNNECGLPEERHTLLVEATPATMTTAALLERAQ